jgi:outer membrane receptor protein involved in Fe transport
VTSQHQDQSGSARRSRARALAAALAWSSVGALAIGIAAPAEAQVAGASLRGTVKAEGGVTQVTAINVNTGLTRSVTVADNGSYNFASLPVGTYRLELTTPDGIRRTDEFALSVGQSAVLDFDFSRPEIARGQGDDAIIVTGTRIRTMEGGEVGTNITQRMIEQLPQINRNFMAFADLAPGVQFITASNENSRLQGGAQGSASVNIFIDGVGQKDYVLKNGVTGQDSTPGNPFPQLAVGEYRVIGSNYKAEYDQVSSVAITAITKSGTNEFHGDAFFDFTNQGLRDARPSELFGTSGKIRTKDMQFGGALGGPIVKDMLHFFVTYEGKRIISPRETNPGLDLPISYFPTKYQGYFGPANQVFNENLYFGKLNFTPTSNDLFEFSVKYRDESGETFNTGISAYESRTISKVEEWRGLARWEHTGDNWVNDFKVAYEDVVWGPRPYTMDTAMMFNARVPTGVGNATRIGDILRIGGGNNYQDKGQSGWTVSDDFTWTGLEGHTFKIGAKAKWVSLNTIQLNYENPLYRYTVHRDGAGSFNDTIPYQVTFTAAHGADSPQITSKNFQFGIYAQDDWDIDDRLTLNIGLRWDYERTPAYLNYVHKDAYVNAVSPANYPNLINADYDINDYISTGSERKAFKGAWQPRLGFSYKIDDAGRFTLFGGYGRSYDRTQFDFIRQEINQGVFGDRTFNFYVPGSPDPEANRNCTPSATCVAWDPIYLTAEGRAQLAANSPVGAGGEMRFIKNDLKMPYSDQFSLGVRGKFSLLELEAGYSYVESKDGFAYLLGNRRPDGSFFVYNASGAPGSPFGISPAPFGNMLIGVNGIETRANTGYLKMMKRYTAASPWSLDATYTYTKADENRQFGEYFSQDYPSMEDYPFTRSSGVRTHRFVMAGTVDMPYDMTLSGKFQIASPIWLKRFVNRERPGGPEGTVPGTTDGVRDVVAIETEGNGDLWGYRQMDIALTKYVRIGFPNDEARVRLRVDIINLFNDRNYSSFSAVTGKRNLTNYDIGGPPRTIKLSAGFSF